MINNLIRYFNKNLNIAILFVLNKFWYTKIMWDLRTLPHVLLEKWDNPGSCCMLLHDEVLVE